MRLRGCQATRLNFAYLIASSPQIGNFQDDGKIHQLTGLGEMAEIPSKSPHPLAQSVH